MRGCGRRSRGRSGPVGAAAAAAAEQQQQQQPQPPGPEVACVSPRVNRFCPQCGSGVEPAFRFCPACGERLPQPPPPEKDVEQRASVSPPQAQSPAAASPRASPRASPARPPLAAWPTCRSPRKARPGPLVPLPVEAVLTDQGGRQWRLLRLLEQGGGGLLYEAQSASGTCPQKQRFLLKLVSFDLLGRESSDEKDCSARGKGQLSATELEPKDVKDGRIYNEQNFFQRAAKAATVEKWKKGHSVPLLGIPNCLGFGLHADSYRFLVFSDLGRTLQSVLSDGLQLLKEKAASQLAVRLLDCLEYIHENEYVHGDITADNIYLNPADLAQVTLAGYSSAFRYCPGGKHVAQREGSRTPHEGTLEFISLDSHKGAGPSRRSDLESLGYCLLKWLCGCLPWSDELDKVQTVVEKKEKYRKDVRGLLQLCFRQRAIPDALQGYLQQVMALEYEEKPDYEALRQLFKKALEKMKASAYDSLDLKMVP